MKIIRHEKTAAVFLDTLPFFSLFMTDEDRSFAYIPEAASMYRDFPVLKPGLNAVSQFGNMTGILIPLRRRTIYKPGKELYLSRI